MSLLDNAMQHFSQDTDQSLHRVDVPEWDGALWFKAVASMNGTQYQSYYKAAQKADYASLVDVLILRARKEDGTKMFTSADKDTLMNMVSPSVVTKAITDMNIIDAAAGEAVKKS